MPPPRVNDFTIRDENLVLYPLSTHGFPDWKDRSVEEIRAALRTKVVANVPASAAASASTVFGSTSKLSVWFEVQQASQQHKSQKIPKKKSEKKREKPHKNLKLEENKFI